MLAKVLARKFNRVIEDILVNDMLEGDLPLPLRTGTDQHDVAFTLVYSCSQFPPALGVFR